MSLTSHTLTLCACAVTVFGISSVAAQNEVPVNNDKVISDAAVQTDASKDSTAAAQTTEPEKTCAKSTTSLKVQETCPITGGKIDKSAYVDYEGQRIYVSNNTCKSEVAKDPEKYLKKLAALGESVEKIEVSSNNTSTATN